MPTIELIYFTGCPNVPKARERLARALALANLPTEWVEWDTRDAGSPDYAKRFGSPTILVDGRDVAEAPGGELRDTCRLYRHPDGTRGGAPAVRDILAALPPTDADASDPERDEC